ncbi:MAG: hypothetical protein EOO01_44900 [Chitinophagaceae bacterium]|nr:MAG: hypothetical protein EOO01_44900 [Chitinophagaceae bacterium]
MATITDFKEWISGVDLEDHNEVYCLFNAVKKFEEWGGFDCKERETSRGRMYFVKCSYSDDVLMLASEKARTYFLDYLEKTYAGEMGMEGWYYFKEAMAKDE